MIHKFREQVQQRGYYSEIDLIANYDEKALSELVIRYKADHEWEVACRAGILIFFDYFGRLKKGKLEVDIEEILWLPVDTNNTIIVYSTVLALCKELDFDIADLKFDKTNMSFTFPESRNLLAKGSS